MEGDDELTTSLSTVGYSVVAFNLIIPQSLDPLLLLPHFPFNGDAPPFPELDPRTADATLDTKTVLQLSRLTMVMDEHVAGNGKGVFGFVSSLSLSLPFFHPSQT